MFLRIVKGAPSHALKCKLLFKKYLHISVGLSNQKILENQSLILNDSVLKIKNKNAKKMLEVLSLRNPYVGNNKVNFLSQFIKSEKKIYPNNIILLKNGLKYESFDTDSVLLVEHCDLDFLGETAHVEFPVTELEKIVNKLLDAGIDVNVYEELVNGSIFTNENKSFYLNRIYYSNKFMDNEHEKEKNNFDEIESMNESEGLEITTEAISKSDNKIVGLGYDEDGYSISVVDLKGEVSIYRNLNEICVEDYLNKLNNRIVILQDGSAKIKSVFKNLPNVLHYHIMQGGCVGDAFHTSVLQEIMTRLNMKINFKVNRINLRSLETGRFNYLDNRVINKLGNFHEQIVPTNSPSYVKRYFKRLLYRYPEEFSVTIREINKILSNLTVSMIQVKNVFNLDELSLENLVSLINVYKYYSENLPKKLVQLLFDLVVKDLNVSVKYENLGKIFRKMTKVVDSYVSKDWNKQPKPQNFLIRQLTQKKSKSEMINRNLLENELNRVERSFERLLTEIYTKFVDSESGNVSEYFKSNMTSDIRYNNNMIYLKKITGKVNHVNLNTTQVIEDKKLISCYVSDQVNLRLLEYINECQVLDHKVSEVISKLQKSLNPYRQLIQIVLHFVVTLQSFYEHVTHAILNQWTLVEPKGVDDHMSLSSILSNLGLYCPSKHDSYSVDTNTNFNIENTEVREKKINRALKRLDPKLIDRVKMLINHLYNLTSFNIERDFVHLSYDNLPPPNFSNSPILYILVFNPSSAAMDCQDTPENEKVDSLLVYVGETGDILSRLQRHRSKKSVHLSDYFQDQFINYNQELNNYLHYIYMKNAGDIGNEGDIVNKSGLMVEFNKMEAILVKLKSRRECKEAEKKMIQFTYKYPDLFITLSKRDGQQHHIPYVD